VSHFLFFGGLFLGLMGLIGNMSPIMPPVSADQKTVATVQTGLCTKHFPKFTLKRLTEKGGEFSSDGLTGKIVLLDFWASWCGPCVEELKVIEKLSKDSKFKHVVFLAISVDDDEATAKRFMKKHKLQGPIFFFDPGKKLSTACELEAIPAIFLLDSNGAVKFTQTGFGTDDEAALRKLINSLTR
jgi:thiol-disulfide isomerase/thioredoxin